MSIVQKTLFRLAVFMLTVPGLAGCGGVPAPATDIPFAYRFNEHAMYGARPSLPAFIESDNAFIAANAKFGYTRAQGSDVSVKLGWQYFFKRDVATAMKRFNQAWLLDPDNGDAFHGFAVVAMDRDKDPAQADTFFKEGIAKPRQGHGIYLDYGRFLLGQKRPSEAITQLNKALSFADMGPDAQALLSMALIMNGDVREACAASIKVQDRAQKPLVDSARAIGRLPACAQP